MNVATRSPIMIGDPIHLRGRSGFVGALKVADHGRALLGAGAFERISHDVEIVWHDGTISTMPDAIARPGLADAAMRGFPREPDAIAKHATAIARRDDERRERAEAAARQAAAEAAFREDAAARIPPWAKAVVVAELVNDQSDSMTDYYGSTTARTVILAFSRHTRDLFPELRRAALNHPDVAHLAEAPAKAEHREKYSMGGGYYLKDGYRHASGWRVRKARLWGDDPARTLPVGEWSLAPAASPEPATAETGEAVAIADTIRVEEHTHTRKGFRMWVAILPGRVDRAEFDRLRAVAEALGGWYSRPWGGTPGGFAFKDPEAARAFAEPTPVEPAPPSAAHTREPAPVPGSSIAPKLRALADGMEQDIAAKLGDRLANTPKRRREADSARIDGARLQLTQRALRALAALHDAGTVPDELRAVTSRKAAYDLLGSIIDRSRAGYYDAGIDTGQPASSSPAAIALWALAGAQSEAERNAEALRRAVADLRFADIPGFFPTPAAIVAQMIDAAELPDGRAFDLLEPEAGSGAILDAVREGFPLARTIAFERHATLRDVLARKGYDLAGADFLEADPAACADVVLMNPPFENGQDIAHVRHAFEFLRPGGRLIAIMSPGPFFREDRRAAEFREWLDELGGERRDLPPGSFKESGTGAAAVLVTIGKPAAAAELPPGFAVGNCHFRSLRDAERYYAPYGLDRADVARKLADGEIAVGPPPLSAGNRYEWDADGRAVVRAGA